VPAVDRNGDHRQHVSHQFDRQLLAPQPAPGGQGARVCQPEPHGREGNAAGAVRGRSAASASAARWCPSAELSKPGARRWRCVMLCISATLPITAGSGLAGRSRSACLPAYARAVARSRRPVRAGAMPETEAVSLIAMRDATCAPLMPGRAYRIGFPRAVTGCGILIAERLARQAGRALFQRRQSAQAPCRRQHHARAARWRHGHRQPTVAGSG